MYISFLLILISQDTESISRISLPEDLEWQFKDPNDDSINVYQQVLNLLKMEGQEGMNNGIPVIRVPNS